MKNRKVIVTICLLFTCLALDSCTSPGNSAIVGKWKDQKVGIIWNFNSDGSFREDPASSIWENKTSKYGKYRVIGKKLILDTNRGEHVEFRWHKPNKNRLTFGNEAGGYWECERVY
jgi:hypothetical protein